MTALRPPASEALPSEPAMPPPAAPAVMAAIPAAALAGDSGGAGRSGRVGQGDAVDLSGPRAGPEAPYLNATRELPRPAFELKAGSVIPEVMIGGVSSDRTDTMVVQVRQNVYDTATGRLLLIPQGARLVGRYDSRVGTGHEQVAVGWTRLVIPDASTLDWAAWLAPRVA